MGGLMNFDEIRPCWLEINLDNLKHNIHIIKSNVNPNSEIMAVIKANAYNHGAITIAKELINLGVKRFAVSILSEGLELRENGIDEPILLLNYIRDSEIKEAIKHDLTMTVYDYEQAKLISKYARELNLIAKIHIKLDTGMSRIGFLPGEVALQRANEILSFNNINCEGIYTHFATADIDDRGQTKEQYNKFIDFTEKLEKLSGKRLLKHLSNSAAIMDYPEYAMDIIRPGIILYGYKPSETIKNNWDLKPLMTLKALVSNIKILPAGSGISYGHSYVTKRITKVATIPLGYADGISRLLSNHLEVFYNGQKLPSIGNICMDQFMVDATDVEGISIGDEITIIGNTKEEANLEKLAKTMGTIHYELLCMISRRIPRVYMKNDKVWSIINYV